MARVKVNTVLAAAMVGLLVPSAASAKGAHPFDRHVARAGSAMRVSVGDLPVVTSSPWTTRRVVRVSVYLVPLRFSRVWWPIYNGYGFAWGDPPKIQDGVRLGRLNVSRAGSPRLVIRVPRVPAGRYVLGYWAAGARWTSARPDLQIDPYGVLTVRT